MNTETLTLTNEPPTLALDLSAIKIYRDGSSSTTAQTQLDDNLKTIREREEVLKLLRLFIQKYRETLAGLYWRVAYLDPEIELSKGWYRGERIDAKGVARLWPHCVTWTRVKPQYSSRPAFDWIGTLNGITLRICEAETWEPVVPPTEGTMVEL